MSAGGKSPMEQLFPGHDAEAAAAAHRGQTAANNNNSPPRKGQNNNNNSSVGKRRRHRQPHHHNNKSTTTMTPQHQQQQRQQQTTAPGTPQTPPAKRSSSGNVDQQHAMEEDKGTTTTTATPQPQERQSGSDSSVVELSILVTRTDLYDNGHQQQQQHSNAVDGPLPPQQQQQQYPLQASSSSTPPPAATATAISTSPLPGYIYPRPPAVVGPFRFCCPREDDAGAGAASSFNNNNNNGKKKKKKKHQNYHSSSIAVVRVPPYHDPMRDGMDRYAYWQQVSVMDKSLPNPHMDAKIDKYWYQRRRLFSQFDAGIQLDPEGFFSVTPEQIADHVATQTVQDYVVTQNNNANSNNIHDSNHHDVSSMDIASSSSPSSSSSSSSSKMVILDAFCGCGGNSIAFAKQENVEMVLAVDVDKTKLQFAANNARIYQIPRSKIRFIHCNVLFVLEHCYKYGQFVLDQPLSTPEQAMELMAAMPPPVPTETCCGFQIGGIDLLPRTIHAVFMDPPWGGVDYSVFGKNGYCLQTNMRIPRPVNAQQEQQPVNHDGMLSDGFFDSFLAAEPRNKQERKAAFNVGLDSSNCVNGAELLQLAAAAAEDARVIYDVPRNTGRHSLGQAALTAGYRGNCKLEEHYLNGRLKTVTAYFGRDWQSKLLPDEA